MGNENEQEKQINDAMKDAKESIGNISQMFDKMLSNIMPQSAPKSVKLTMEIDGQIVECAVDAYIAMNNILCMDFKDKNQMKKYFDDLK